MINVCQFCGKEFKTSRKDAKYCSRQCMGLAKRKNLPDNYCLICGKMISKNFKVGDRYRKYCSQECYNISKYKTNDFKIIENIAYITINSKKFGELKCLIDTEDLDKVKDICWNVDKDKYPTHKNIRMHNLILSPKEGCVIDHINHNTLDNRKCNLRIVTYRANNLNRILNKNNKTGITGVRFKKNENVYEVYYGKIYCGRYKTLEEAKNKRLEMEQKDKEHLNYRGE